MASSWRRCKSPAEKKNRLWHDLCEMVCHLDETRSAPYYFHRRSNDHISSNSTPHCNFGIRKRYLFYNLWVFDCVEPIIFFCLRFGLTWNAPIVTHDIFLPKSFWQFVRRYLYISSDEVHRLAVNCILYKNSFKSYWTMRRRVARELPNWEYRREPDVRGVVSKLA